MLGPLGDLQGASPERRVPARAEPVTKLDKRNTSKLKNWTMTYCRQIVTSLSFFSNLRKMWQPS